MRRGATSSEGHLRGHRGGAAVLAGSHDIIDPAMTALRDVGPIGRVRSRGPGRSRPIMGDRAAARRGLMATSPKPVDRHARVHDQHAPPPRARAAMRTTPRSTPSFADLASSRAPWCNWSSYVGGDRAWGRSRAGPCAAPGRMRGSPRCWPTTIDSRAAGSSGWPGRRCRVTRLRLARPGHDGATRPLIQELPPSAATSPGSTSYHRCGSEEARYLHEHTWPRHRRRVSLMTSARGCDRRARVRRCSACEAH